MNVMNGDIHDPRVWGPHYWFVMKTSASLYPDNPSNQIKIETKNFFNAFKFLLPCDNCREHYATLYDKYPIDDYLVSQNKLKQWVIILQSEINRNILNSQSITVKTINKQHVVPTNRNDSLNTSKHTINHLSQSRPMINSVPTKAISTRKNASITAKCNNCKK
jgi:hypothetical protein